MQKALVGSMPDAGLALRLLHRVEHHASALGAARRALAATARNNERRASSVRIALGVECSCSLAVPGRPKPPA
jgi:hypothetical protein